MKIAQFCSVCKEELDMEVVPTADGEEEGVLWLRCPRCQGFLPKISSSLEHSVGDDEEGVGADEPLPVLGDSDEPARKNENKVVVGDDSIVADTDSVTSPVEPAAAPTVEEESIAAYTAMLVDADLTKAVPYRPWEKYEIGDVIHHLAWEDCGVVVDKERLPGNRQVVKVFFEKTGVVRLIEEDSRPT